MNRTTWIVLGTVVAILAGFVGFLVWFGRLCEELGIEDLDDPRLDDPPARQRLAVQNFQ